MRPRLARLVSLSLVPLLSLLHSPRRCALASVSIAHPCQWLILHNETIIVASVFGVTAAIMSKAGGDIAAFLDDRAKVHDSINCP